MNQKGFITPLIVIIVIIATGIGGYVFVQYQKMKNENSYAPVQNPPANTPQSPTPAPTLTSATASIPADWKTYRNEKYGFEVRYPKNLEIKESQNGNLFKLIFSLHLQSTDFYPLITVKINKTPGATLEMLKEIEQTFKKEKFITTSWRSLDGIQALKVKFDNGLEFIEFIKNDYIFQIESLNNANGFSKFLDDFHFIK